MTVRLGKDISLILASRILRNFYFSYISFLLPIYFRFIGFSYIYIGLYVLISTISSSILVLISGFLGDLYSRKNMLIIMSSLTIIFFGILLLAHDFLIIFLSSLLGISMSATGGGSGGGPVAPLINAMVADRIRENRTSIYSLLSSSGTFSGVLGGFASYFIISDFEDYYRILFSLGLVLAVISTIVIIFIHEDRKTGRVTHEKKIIPVKSGKRILMISLAGGFGSLGLGIIMPLISLYFKIRGLSPANISLIFTAAYILSGIAVLIAPHVERMMGSVKGISLLRFLGSILIVLIPFFPILFGAVIYIIRTAIYQMALPIRQNFSMEVFAQDERSRGSSITGIFRRLPYGIATSIGGVLFSAGLFLVAFISAGSISVLDPILYYLFFNSYAKDGD